MKKFLCKCGNQKPYRRAYACTECWSKKTNDEVRLMLQNRTTLRLGEPPVIPFNRKREPEEGKFNVAA